MTDYDITFLGHMCYDEIIPWGGKGKIAPGSAVLCGAMAAARVGTHTAAIVKMAEKDHPILQSLGCECIDVTIIPAEETTFSRVEYYSTNHDERRITLTKSAGLITIDQLPEIHTRYLHLAGISNEEFNLDLIRALKEKGHTLTVDMQCFVRQVDPVSREIVFGDIPLRDKQEIFRLTDIVKLDVVEARALTQKENLLDAARVLEDWGAKELVMTQNTGVWAWSGKSIWTETFSNASNVGRTGRGDTTFAAYLAYRLEHDIPSSLQFAAALVSIKMEMPGPFQGNQDDVLARIALLSKN